MNSTEKPFVTTTVTVTEAELGIQSKLVETLPYARTKEKHQAIERSLISFVRNICAIRDMKISRKIVLHNVVRITSCFYEDPTVNYIFEFSEVE